MTPSNRQPSAARLIRAMEQRRNSHYQFSLWVPGNRWITVEADGSYALRFNNGTTDNILFQGTAAEVAQVVCEG